MADFPRPVLDPLSCESLEKLAGEIHKLVHRFKALGRFRDMVRRWNATVDPVDPLSFPLPERALSLEEKYAVLAAIHDRCNIGGVVPINPWPDEQGTTDGESGQRAVKRIIEAQWWISLCGNVLAEQRNSGLKGQGIPKRTEVRLQTILTDVEADLKESLGNAGQPDDGANLRKLNAIVTASEIIPWINKALLGKSQGKRRRRAKGVGRSPAAAIILAGLVKHHGYDNGRCEVLTPIVVKRVAGHGEGKWGVSSGSLSNFLKDNFGGFDAYCGKCSRGEIAAELKRLLKEYQSRNHCSLPADATDA